MAKDVNDNLFLGRRNENNVEQRVNLSSIKENWSRFFLVPGAPHFHWPKEVTVFTPLNKTQMILPDFANSWTIKTYLKMCNLNFEVTECKNAEFMSPSLTVPFIKVDNSVIAEFEEIINHLNARNIKLTDTLDKEQLINLNAFMSLVPNVMQLSELYMSWCFNENYQKYTRPKYSGSFPWPLNLLQLKSKRQQISKKLNVNYWSRKSLKNVLTDFENCCEAISCRLEGKTRFFQGQNTELDACIFGHLYAILTTNLPKNHLQDIVKKFPCLLDYVENMKETFI